MTPPTRRGPRQPVVDKTIIGPYLRRARLALGLTQAEVADAAGIERSQYVGYENSRRGMEVTKAPGLAKALRVPEAEIRVLAEEHGAMAELAVQLAEQSTQLADLRARVARLEDDERGSRAGRAKRAGR